MSADNGIYILKTVKGEGFEYRVAHLQAVENMDWDDKTGEHTIDPDVSIRNARDMWKDCSVWKSDKDATNFAQGMEYAIGYVEYGTCVIEIDREF